MYPPSHTTYTHQSRLVTQYLQVSNVRQVYNSGGVLSLDLILCQSQGLTSKLLEVQGRLREGEVQVINSSYQCHFRSHCHKPA